MLESPTVGAPATTLSGIKLLTWLIETVATVGTPDVMSADVSAIFSTSVELATVGTPVVMSADVRTLSASYNGCTNNRCASVNIQRSCIVNLANCDITNGWCARHDVG